MVQSSSTASTSKTELTSSIKNVLYELPHKLPNNFRLKIFGNKEILRKFQNGMGTQTSVQSE